MGGLSSVLFYCDIFKEDFLMFRSIGFIGTGHMGSALARVAAKGAAGAPVYLANRTQEKARRLAQELDCGVADNETIAQHCDLIFLGVKPQLMGQVLGSLSPILGCP